MRDTALTRTLNPDADMKTVDDVSMQSIQFAQYLCFYSAALS